MKKKYLAYCLALSMALTATAPVAAAPTSTPRVTKTTNLKSLTPLVGP